jgi:hypothetical protein
MAFPVHRPLFSTLTHPSHPPALCEALAAHVDFDSDSAERDVSGGTIGGLIVRGPNPNAG